MLVEGLPLPVVDELQRQAEVVALHQGDDRLQVILLLGRDAQFLALHLGPDAFRPLVPDELGDLPGVVGGDAFLEADPEPVLLAGGLRVAGIEGLERDPTLDQLLLEHVEHRLGSLLAVGADVDGVIPGPGDGRAHAAEVEPGADLLGGLVEGVVDFVAVDAADDVERRLGGHRLLLSSAGQSPTVKRLLRSRRGPRQGAALPAPTAADAILSTDPATEASVWRGLTRLARSGHCRAQAVPPSPSRRRRSAAVIASARPVAPSHSSVGPVGRGGAASPAGCGREEGPLSFTVP